ncbi:growth arrest-specific protein 1a [Triplophysa dalaica]|uniref:growth arrest-specific protein 1a n=1 Tax=Triplophysa dalaica TaxID=1582913 RepID=UPI0024DF70B7|nr:growth arrest-specific protein 1a [Triplophysa dalaica]
MANCAGLRRDARALIWSFACVLACFTCSSIASSNHGRRLICWQAIAKCHSEPECHYAYDQYLHACEPILTGHRRKCPSHCISSLVQLNLTKNGPALEDCSCASDPRCRETKRAIEPCLPKTSSMGCTEARRQCARDGQCQNAMGDYLHHCGKLFSGSSCSNSCRNVIAYMRKLPKAQLLDTCVCDGSERTICEFIKTSMRTLCFDSPHVDEEGSGGLDDSENDDYEDEPVDSGFKENTGSALAACSVLTSVASILVALITLKSS